MAYNWSYLLTLLGPLVATLGFIVLVRPRVSRRNTRQAGSPEPVTERREPRDTSRPYPRPSGLSEDDERLLTCPVCGMEDPLFLDGGPAQGDLFGWPAHRTCVEWLGAWKPARPGGQKLELTATARAFMPGRVTDRAAEFVNGNLRELSAGIITLDELRERIVGAFGIPEMTYTASSDAGTLTCDCGMTFHGSVADLDRSMEVHRTSGQHEQRMAYEQRMGSATGAPVQHMWCTCGKEFTGTPLGIQAVMDAHHHSGECPHSAAGRARQELCTCSRSSECPNCAASRHRPGSGTR